MWFFTYDENPLHTQHPLLLNKQGETMHMCVTKSLSLTREYRHLPACMRPLKAYFLAYVPSKSHALYSSSQDSEKIGAGRNTGYE